MDYQQSIIRMNIHKYNCDTRDGALSNYGSMHVGQVIITVATVFK